jgi:gliding motility-associated-like protein
LPAGTTTYSYSNGFPNDGFYTVTNGTFGNVYDWHQIEDHTVGDINGKCLIVNASFSAGEFYRKTISGLCEATTYEFSAWLINLLKVPGFCVDQGIAIPVNVRFEIWDSTDTNILASGNTGNIIENAIPTWEQFGLVFQTLAGQNTVILKMINNGQGGCGNDLAIDDIVFKSCGDNVLVTDTNNTNFNSLCSSELPFNETLTAIPDFSVYNSHFYQWQESTDGGVTWTDINGQTNQTLLISPIISTIYRAKIAEYAINLSNDQCVSFSTEYQVSITQLPMQPTLECWETAIINTNTCSWEISGTQPPEPTGLECWETAVFNSNLCVWEVTGSQPEEPTGLECWESTSFNINSCSWEISGTQPPEPTGLECWEIAVFNSNLCVWEVTGSQPEEPTGLECWESTSFNLNTCSWEITGTEPAEPTGLECWETATFNTNSCSWEVSGSQPPEPTGLECWETATFNNTICTWEITGTEPSEPTGLECWETATFNTNSCSWEISGTQPPEPTGLECWESAVFNSNLCVWEINGTEPTEPTDLECWQTATFNTLLCDWEITGTQPGSIIEENLVLCPNSELELLPQTEINNPSYLWSNGETTSFINVTTSGTYSVEISGGICDFETWIYYVILKETPIIDTIISEGNEIIITTLNSGDFIYSIDGVNFQQSPIFYNVEGGLYTIYVKDINCDDVVTMQHLHFYIPSFFTPNNDGYHDTFNLKGIEYFSSSQVSIFNRYGKLLKFSKNSRFSWDGTFNNKELPTSDYWYVIIIDGQEFKGHFTLKR